MHQKKSPLAILLLVLASLIGGNARAENEGLDKLDEATTLKLTARSAADLEKVVDLCKQAIEDGLDETNASIAKRVLAATAMQRAQGLWQQLPALARNPRAVKKLRDEVIGDLDDAIEANPELHNAFTFKAEVLAGIDGNVSGAIDSVNKAIELLDQNPAELAKAYILRAKLQQDPAQKLADFNKAVEVDSTNTDAWQAVIVLRMQQGDFKEAVADAKVLLERDSDNLFALQAVFDSLLRLEEYTEAVELISERIGESSDNAALYLARARAYEQLSFDQDATEEQRDEYEGKELADLNRVIELNKKDSEALRMRAELYFRQGDTEKAQRDIADSLALGMNFRSLLSRAMIAAADGRMSEAIEDLEKVVEAAPESFLVLRLAQYYQIDEQPRKAMDILEVLLAKEPDNWEAKRLLGDCYLSIGEHDKAIESYDAAVATAEKSKVDDDTVDLSGLLNNYSWVLATSPVDEIRDGNRAVELGLRACEMTEYKAAHILSTLAAAYAEVGDFEKARMWSKKAVELGEKGDDKEQLEHLKEELESYKKDKPWRELQETEENSEAFDTDVETIDT